MTSCNRQIGLWLWIATSGFLIVSFFDCLWSVNTDYADHTAFVNRLFDNWSLPQGYTSSCHGPPENCHMYYYPPSSHILAAMFAVPLSSPVGGVQLATLLSMVGLWTGFALIFQSLPRRTLGLVAALLFVLLVLNRFVLQLELHGHEVVGMFFYPQFVAQTLAIAMLAGIALAEYRGAKPGLTYLLLVFSIPIVESVHLLPTVQLFSVLLVLIAVDWLASPQQRRFKTLVLGTLATVAAFIEVIVHPTFKHFVQISSAEGGFGLLRTNDPMSLAILCVVVGLLSLLLLYKIIYPRSEVEVRPHSVAVKYIACYAIANCALCLFQMFMLQLGFGSWYACKKYGFALNTCLLFELALLAGLILESRWGGEGPPKPGLAATLFDVAFVSLYVAAAFYLTLPSGKQAAASRLASIERFARTYRQTAFHNLPGTFDYAVGLKDVPPIVNYMISWGPLQAPFPEENNTEDVYANRPFSQPSLIGHILTSVNSRPWDMPRCRTQFASPSLVILDGPCVVSALNSR